MDLATLSARHVKSPLTRRCKSSPLLDKNKREEDSGDPIDEARPRPSNPFHRARRAVEGTRYVVIFALGVGCSLLMGWFQPDRVVPENVREQARIANLRLTRAFEEVISSETIEGFYNTTAKLKAILDAQSLPFSGVLINASLGFRELLPTKPFGITELLNLWQVPDISQVLGRSERIGVRMARAGLTVHSPIVMIPGIITTGLEVWDGEECMKTYFRQRIWGTVTMFQSFLGNPDCWNRHLALNATTGLDPLQRPHFNRSIRVRPAEGFGSTDFFIGGYWLWGLMIEAFADIGYDMNTMYMASYDWRLAFSDLERRDRYFTRLRYQIETLVSSSGEKVVVVAHSMGGSVWHYFMQWVSFYVDPSWINTFISSEILISSPMLGLPKAYYSLLTGDNRDFAVAGVLARVINHFFGLQTRRFLWRTCSSLAMLMPMGGEPLWGRDLMGLPLVILGDRNLTMQEAYDLLAAKGVIPDELKRIEPWLLDGLRRSRPPLQRKHLDANDSDLEAVPEYLWANALAVALPRAPDLKMYAFYGVGVPTEISAVLKPTAQQPSGQVDYGIDHDATSDSGFHLVDGDYSCPVHSLGLLCRKGWSDPARNPAEIPCTVKEYLDKPATLLSGTIIRGGSSSGDHIDILGNDELLADVLTIVSGGQVAGRIVSNLDAIASKWKDSDEEL